MKKENSTMTNIVGLIVATLVYVIGAFALPLLVVHIGTLLLDVPVVSSIIIWLNNLQQGTLINTLIFIAVLLIAIAAMLVMKSMVSKKMYYYIFCVIGIIANVYYAIVDVRSYIETVTEMNNGTVVLDIIEIMCYALPYILVSIYFISTIIKTHNNEEIKLINEVLEP